MRRPSLDALVTRGRAVLARFPFTLIAGATAATAGVVGTADGADEVWFRIVLVAMLGLPFTVALTLLAEARRWPTAVRWISPAAGLLALVGFYLVWPGVDLKHEAIRYLQLSAALHLLVAFLPFLGAPESAGFWQYNRRLFLSFLRAAVFSGVLYVGLAIALGALDRLFGVDVPGETYLRLWFVVAFVANTWIFLAGVPDDLDALEHETEYPRALKVFTQYILTPLVAVYLVILLAYLVKILVTGEWPSGWIGYLVTSVAVAGLLGFLLVHPLSRREDEAWIAGFSRGLFLGLIPAALMFLAALWQRIRAYGFTELRWLGLLLGLWLLAVAVLYTIRRDRGIRLIPLSLAALLLLTLYGPVSATHRAVASQSARLARLLDSAGDGNALGAVTPAEREASGALRFLLEHRAEDEIRSAFGGELPGMAALPDSMRFREDSVANVLLASAGLDYAHRTPREGQYFHVSAQEAPTPITGFDWMLGVSGADSTAEAIGGDTVRTRFDSMTSLLTVQVPGDEVLRFDLTSIADSLAGLSGVRSRTAPADALWLADSVTGWRGQLRITWLNGRHGAEGNRVTAWRGTLLLGARR